ncbi:MAG: hypothetical protein WD097_09765 [Balneolales bacterium]
MKILFFLSIVLFVPFLAYSQGLNSNATHIRETYPDEYQKTIRAFAVKEWENDHTMVVYTINQQSDALISLIRSFKSEHTNILFRAIQEWSHSGYKATNIEKFRELSIINLEQMIGIYADWTMVKYVYDQQTAASQAY